MGAPNLTDGVWLHGWGEEAVVKAIGGGFNNQMPSQAAKLNEAQIHVLTGYVMSLSGKASN